MLKTHIIYKGRKPDTTELQALFPLLNITTTPFRGEMKTVIDPLYQIRTLDWVWFQTLFNKDVDVRCLVLLPSDLKGVGITDHWGFYSLDDLTTDTTHDFYMTNLSSHPKATANGFKTAFTWMWVHEYLHGAVWEQTQDREQAAVWVHVWETQGILKAKLAEYIQINKNKRKELSLWQRILELVQLMKKPQPVTVADKLLPLVQRKADAMVSEMKRLGHDIRITQGFRSKAEQDRLYAQGRTTPGAVVTNARGGESWHNYGLAVDLVFRKEGFNAPKSLWNLLGKVGEAQGFEWGGNAHWIKAGFVDKPHFSMTLGYTLKDAQSGKIDYNKFN